MIDAVLERLAASVVLQSDALSCYTSEGSDMYGCAIGELTAALGGQSTFGFLVGGTILLSIYIAGDGDLAAPTVLTILLGGLLFPILPGAYAKMAWAIIFVGLVAGGLSIANKYLLSGAFR